MVDSPATEFSNEDVWWDVPTLLTIVSVIDAVVKILEKVETATLTGVTELLVTSGTVHSKHMKITALIRFGQGLVQPSKECN